MPSFAERALEGMPKRPTVGHVAGALEADVVARQLKAERERREAKRQERIAREQREKEAERTAAHDRVRVALAMTAIHVAAAMTERER